MTTHSVKNYFFTILLISHISLLVCQAQRVKSKGEWEDVDDEEDTILVPTTNSTGSRNGKMYPFWEVVKVPNSICFGGGKQGVCKTSKSCSKDDGTSLGGSCANGYGVCCELKRSCSVNNNGSPTTIRSSGTHILPPTPLNAPFQCTFRIPRRSSNVCQVRLDFIAFNLAPPNPLVSSGDCVTDSMTINGADNLDGFFLCGQNAGKHLYLHYGNSEIILLAMSITRISSNYDILVNFVNCGNSKNGGGDSSSNSESGSGNGKGGKGRQSRRFMNNNNNQNNNNSLEIEPAPFGCSQYYTKATDVVQSFNYMSLPAPPTLPVQAQINNEQYTVCVKTVPGSRQITWSQCTGEDNNGFSVSSPQTVCTTDFVDIPGGMPAGRHCGNTFQTVTSMAKPYTMYVNFNGEEIYGGNLPVDPISNCPVGYVCYMNGIPAADGTFCDYVNQPTVFQCRPSIGIINLSDFDNRGFCLQYRIS